jgi:TetR/AcrR family transcriptional regulator
MSVTPQRQGRAERTRAQILEAAALRFAERGFSATRLDDVGQDVGIGRSAVLYHFKDKRLLYRAVLDELFGGLLATLRSPLMREGTLADRIEAAVSAFVDYMGRHPTAARLALRESINSDAMIREEIQAQSQPFLSLLEMIFEEGERSGMFRPLRSDPLHFVSTVAGSTLFYVAALPTFVGELPYDLLCAEQLEAHKRDVLDITRRLLGIRGPRPVVDQNG